MESIKKWTALIIKHGAPIGLFILLPLLVALYLGHNIITLERNKHISQLSSQLESRFAEMQSEIAPEAFLLMLGRGAWVTFRQNENNLDKYWDYYRWLIQFLGTEPDLYVFDEKGGLATPRDFNLKSRFIATKLWESIDSDYNARAERFYKMKKQFKSFLGNEFKFNKFLEGRDHIMPIIVNTNVGYVYWMNSENNPKKGIFIIFWEKPSLKIRLNQIIKRYNQYFDDGFVRNFIGESESFFDDANHLKSDYESVYMKTVLLGQNERYIDQKGLLWRAIELDGLNILAGIKSRAFIYDRYHNCFMWLAVILGIIAVIVYVLTERQKDFYLSIRTKLVGLFLIAVLTPVMGFSYLGYQYVGDMRENLYESVWSEGRDLLLDIDRELGLSGNVFRDDFRQIVKDFQKYDESAVVRNKITESLEKHELGHIDQRLASDASIIKQITNQVVLEGITDVADAFSKCCIDSMLNTNLMDTMDPGLRSALTSPECGLTSFWIRPDNVQDFMFGSSEFYLYWTFAESAKYGTEYFLILRATDKVLRNQLKNRLLECKTNPKEKDYLIVACNNRNGEWFPDNSLARNLKSTSKRIVYMGKPIESEIYVNSKRYLLLALNSNKIRGYSFYALYPYEKIQKKLSVIIWYITAGIVFFILMALAIGYVLSETFLYPVKRLEDGVKAIKGRDSSFRIEALQNDEFGELANSFNKMISDLKEMELAKYIQESLLPHSIPELKGYELCFSNRMASAVGGDYFDTMLLDEDNLCIIIGDVSGHGVASALVMAIAKAIIYHSFNETRDLLEVFSDLNLVINTYFNRPPVKKMITLFGAIINLPTGKAVFTDAGHNFPMHIAVDGSVTELKMTGLPVGVMRKMRKQHTDEFSIDKGEAIVFYTDGIVEVTGHTEEQYGYDRFKENLSQLAGENANTIMNTLLAKYDTWLAGTDPDDDVTCVVLKRLAS